MCDPVMFKGIESARPKQRVPKKQSPLEIEDSYDDDLYEWFSKDEPEVSDDLGEWFSKDEPEVDDGLDSFFSN